MSRRSPRLRDMMAARPKAPYLPDGTLDPREWEIACSAANVISAAVLHDEPWFVRARPVEVRWLSPEVWKKVPTSVDGYLVNVVLEGHREELRTIH